MVEHAEHTQPPLGRKAEKHLHHHLSKLAVLHEIPEDLLGTERSQQTRVFIDVAEGDRKKQTAQHIHGKPGKRFFLPGIKNPMDIPAWAVGEQIAHEKDQMLRTVHDVIRSEARAAADQIDWAGTSDILLDKAQHAPTPDERNASLVGAAICVQFTSEAAQREGFLKEVYERGLQEDMAKACEQSHLVVLINGLSKKRDIIVDSHSVKSFAPAFELGQDEVLTYLEHVRAASGANNGEADEDLPSAKALHKKLVAHIEAGTTDEETQVKATKVSTRGEKVGGSMLDVYKIERFALEDYFIRQQMHRVLGPDLSKAPLAALLEQKRSQPSAVIDALSLFPQEKGTKTHLISRKLTQLRNDLSDSLKELTLPLIDKFQLDNVDIHNTDALTPDQKATLRFRTVVKKIEQHKAVSRFLNVDDFIKGRDKGENIIAINSSSSDIWAVPLTGGDAPRAATDIVGKIIRGALEKSSNLGPVTQKELYTLAQRNRSKLLRLATFHLIDATEVNSQVARSLSIHRDESGELELTDPLALIPKGSMDVYAAIALGCPALHIQHESRRAKMLMSQAQKLAQGSANYIDHLLAIYITEAYQRDIFDLQTYDSSNIRAAA